MAIEEINFRISEKVDPLIENYQSYTPPANSTVTIQQIVGEGAYTLNSEIRVVWDYNSENSEILWTIRGSGIFSNKIIIDSIKTDGNKVLALVVDNGESNKLNISAHMTILVET